MEGGDLCVSELKSCLDCNEKNQFLSLLCTVCSSSFDSARSEQFPFRLGDALFIRVDFLPRLNRIKGLSFCLWFGVCLHSSCNWSVLFSASSFSFWPNFHPSRSYFHKFWFWHWITVVVVISHSFLTPGLVSCRSVLSSPPKILCSGSASAETMSRL
jgi:hypothetical protein